MREARETIIALRARRAAFRVASAVAKGPRLATDPIECGKCGNRFVPETDAGRKGLCPLCEARLPARLPGRDPNVIPARTEAAEARMRVAADHILQAMTEYRSGSATLARVRMAIRWYVDALTADELPLARELNYYVELLKHAEFGMGGCDTEILSELLTQLADDLARLNPR